MSDLLKEVKMAWARGEEVQFKHNDAWVTWPSQDRIAINAYKEWRVKPKTISINGFDVPEPLRKVESGQEVFYVDITSDDLVLNANVGPVCTWDHWLGLGIVHSTFESAESHAKSLLSFTKPQ